MTALRAFLARFRDALASADINAGVVTVRLAPAPRPESALVRGWLVAERRP